MTSTRAELLELTSYLARRDYVFICPTPESQERVVTKRTNDSSARYSINLEDFFGWSLPAEMYVQQKAHRGAGREKLMRFVAKPSIPSSLQNCANACPMHRLSL